MHVYIYVSHRLPKRVTPYARAPYNARPCLQRVLPPYIATCFLSFISAYIYIVHTYLHHKHYPRTTPAIVMINV